MSGYGMSVNDTTIWWQVYPLGFTGAPIRPSNEGERALTPRLDAIIPWLDYLIDMGANGLLLGPVFASETQRSMVQIHAPLPLDRRSHYRNGGFLYIPWLLLALSSHPAKPSTGHRRSRPPRKFRQWSNRPCSEASTPSIAARVPLP